MGISWTATSVGGGYWKFLNVASGKALEVTGFSTDPGGNIIAWNDTAVRAMVDHNDADHFCRTGEPHDSDNFFEGVNTGAPDQASIAGLVTWVAS